MQTFIANGIPLEYEVIGDGEPFVFLHGMGGSVRQIESVYDPIPGVRLITMNQQGHGCSGADWDQLSFDRLAEDAAALLDELGLSSAAFAGISMGAAVSLNLAVRHPERVSRLLLIRNAWTDQPMDLRLQAAFKDLGNALREGGEEAFHKTAGWDYVKEPSAYTRGAFTLPFSEPDNIRNWQKYLILPTERAIASSKLLAELKMPVTIVACRGDLCHPFAMGEYLHERIPGADFIEIPNKDTDKAGHRREINLAIRKFLKKV